jgi:hypothetical protein
MVSIVMGRASSTPDTTLQRLHEVAERIRLRAAEAREGRAARAGPRERAPRPAAPVELPAAPRPPSPPRHWSDGPVDDADDLH